MTWRPLLASLALLKVVMSEPQIYRPSPWPEQHRDNSTGFVKTNKNANNVWDNFWRDGQQPSIFRWGWNKNNENVQFSNCFVFTTK